MHPKFILDRIRSKLAWIDPHAVVLEPEDLPGLDREQRLAT